MTSAKVNLYGHEVRDNEFDEELILEASTYWPVDDYPHWVTYNNPLERKKAFNDWLAIPLSLQKALFHLMKYDVEAWLGQGPLIPDTSLWGAGLHEMSSGDWLDLHLDHDHHPKFGWRRKANGILFLSDFKPGWGGELELWRPGEDGPAEVILPKAGRLVLLESNDYSLHRVSKLTCPDGVKRKSLAVYWYGVNDGQVKRPRAFFLPIPGENDPAKDELRRNRAILVDDIGSGSGSGS